MKIKLILVSLLLTCANMTVNAKKSEDVKVDKPKVMTTEFNLKNNRAKISKIDLLWSLLKKQPQVVQHEIKLQTIDHVEYSPKQIKVYFY